MHRKIPQSQQSKYQSLFNKQGFQKCFVCYTTYATMVPKIIWKVVKEPLSQHYTYLLSSLTHYYLHSRYSPQRRNLELHEWATRPTTHNQERVRWRPKSNQLLAGRDLISVEYESQKTNKSLRNRRWISFRGHGWAQPGRKKTATKPYPG